MTVQQTISSIGPTGGSLKAAADDEMEQFLRSRPPIGMLLLYRRGDFSSSF